MITSFLIDILCSSKIYLKKNGVFDFEKSAEEILCFVLNCNRSDLLLFPKKKITSFQEKKIIKLLKKRAVDKVPLAYILGHSDFFGCKIKVTKDVLIPRMETEELVEKIILKLKNEDLKNKILWDIGTGSGCIGIAIKKNLPDLKVIVSDISKKAIAVAKENAKLNFADIQIRMGDLFSPFKGEKAHYIVSNPPYIAKNELEKLQKEVKDHEPILALDGGESGMDFYEKFFQQLPVHIYKKSKVFFEIGENQKEILKETFSKNLFFKMSFEKDMSRRDRFFFLEFE